MYIRKLGLALCALVISLMMSSHSAQAGTPVQANAPKTPIQHLIVEMQENHSFDNYFGTYPGADGIPAGACIPADPTNSNNPTCVKPYHIGGSPISDLDHSQTTFKLQYNNGNMNGFVYAQSRRNLDGSIAMGYYDGTDLTYYWNLADNYVLFDRFFSSDGNGSVENHMYRVAAVPGNTGIDPGKGYGTGLPTIFDRLEEKGISWKFYVENYDANINYKTASQINGNRASQIIWAPLGKFDRFIDDPKLSGHIVDLNQYYTDLENGTLPAVSYIVPSGASEHPPGSVQSGEKFSKGLIQALLRSTSWNSSAFLLTWDDWGGWYDHVKPPQVDNFGYGFRVPALLVSTYARRGYIDNTQLDYTSILKFIEDNWNLAPLADRDAHANSFVSAFDFSQAPRAPFYMPFVRITTQTTAQPRRPVIYAFYGAALLFAGLLFTWTTFSDRAKHNNQPINDPVSPNEESKP